MVDEKAFGGVMVWCDVARRGVAGEEMKQDWRRRAS